MSSARAAFRYPDFRRYQAARAASILAIETQSVAVGYQVYALTGDPLDLGYVGLAQFVPFVALSLIGGHTADRHDRRTVLLHCYVAQALCAATLLTVTLLGVPSVLPIYGALVLLGASRAFYTPAAQALLPSVVPAHDFANAITWSSTVRQIVTIAGPAVGGFIYGVSGGAGAVYATSALLLGVAFLSMLRLQTRTGQLETEPLSWATLWAGVRYVRTQRVLLGSISLDLFAVLLGGAVALMPVFARDILKVGPQGLGLLRSAPAMGAAAMALFLAYVPLKRNAGGIMMACVALFGVATIVFGLSRSFALSLVALIVLGAADMVSMVVRLTLEQLATPPAMRGRVGAVNGVFIVASNELGEFESGAVAAWLGVVPSVVVGGIGTLAVVALWSVLFPELRKVDRLEDATKLSG